jgi:regulator of sigma E protease
MLTILLFLLVLGILVLVHEAGHALIAKTIGCRVEEFGIGFPPRLAARRLGETVYSVNIIPLGGFVRITGEGGEAIDDPRSFARKSRGRRAAVLLAGVTMNLLLAVVFFSLIAGIGAPVPVSGVPGTLPLVDRRVEVVEDSDNPVLRNAGIRSGDAITHVGGRFLPSAADAAEAIRGFRGVELPLVLTRDGSRQDVRLLFSEPHVPGEPVGLALLDVATYRVPWRRAPLEGIKATGRTVQATATGLAKLVRDAVQERVLPQDVAGPVGIASIVGTVGRQGILPLMELTAVLSVNLALINALPIPALDGGRVLFVLLEAVGIRRFRGGPERLAHAIGFAVLIGLIMLITIGDIRRLFTS